MMAGERADMAQLVLGDKLLLLTVSCGAGAAAGEKTESGHGGRWVCSWVLKTLYLGYHLKADRLVMLDLLVMAGLEDGEKTESRQGGSWVCSRVLKTLYRGYQQETFGLGHSVTMFYSLSPGGDRD